MNDIKGHTMSRIRRKKKLHACFDLPKWAELNWTEIKLKRIGPTWIIYTRIEKLVNSSKACITITAMKLINHGYILETVVEIPNLPPTPLIIWNRAFIFFCLYSKKGRRVKKDKRKKGQYKTRRFIASSPYIAAIFSDLLQQTGLEWDWAELDSLWVHFSLHSSCVICCCLHSRLQNALSPLYM